MSIKASHLNDEIKQALLQNIRQKLGEYEYNKIYNSIGEDGIIELFLKQTMNENSTASNKSNVAGTIESIFSSVFIIIFICLVWFSLIIGVEHFSLWYGKLLLGIFLAPWIFVIAEVADARFGKNRLGGMGPL